MVAEQERDYAAEVVVVCAESVEAEYLSQETHIAGELVVREHDLLRQYL